MMVFTHREEELLRHLCDGLPDKEIARKIDRDVRTVSNSLSRMYKKIGVHGRSEARKWYEDYLWEQSRARLYGKIKGECKWICFKDEMPSGDDAYVCFNPRDGVYIAFIKKGVMPLLATHWLKIETPFPEKG